MDPSLCGSVLISHNVVCFVRTALPSSSPVSIALTVRHYSLSVNSATSGKAGNDLKAWLRGQKYIVETLKLLSEPPDSIFIDQVVAQIAELERVNHAVKPVLAGDGMDIQLVF